jgi:hypothetical protein
MREFIEIDGRKYRKFIPYPGPVDDGTLRCIACGQIDEPEHHDDALCGVCVSDRPAQEDERNP